jgi:hypothetical protein
VRTRNAGYPYAIVKERMLRIELSEPASLRANELALRRTRSILIHLDNRLSRNLQPMELMGIEPTTSGLQNRRSPS